MKKKNIPGIHNYCDRWCERCPFTDRCAVFESEKDLTAEQQDMQHEAFWERLKENFAKARVMLEQAAKSHGLDFQAIEADMEEAGKQEEDRRKNSEAHTLAQLSRDYGKATDQWLKTQPGMLSKLEKLKEEVGAGVEETASARHQIETIKDSLAVIQWYSNFIYAKFMRALMGKADFGEGKESYPRDFDGSAKIALISVERSMQAWKLLFELLPEEEDHFLTILALLERIRKEALQEFPHAMAFVRPGLDEVSP